MKNYKKEFYNTKSFEENEIHFSMGNPYYISIKSFPTDYYFPLHYSHTLEILVCEGITGNVLIGNNKYTIDSDTIFVIPANNVHATKIDKSTGTLCIFQVSFKNLSQYLNLEKILQNSNFDNIPYISKEYSKLKRFINVLKMQDDLDMTIKIKVLLSMFRILSSQSVSEMSTRDVIINDTVKDLILWTKENYNKRIKIEDAANFIGLSKYYFCSWFKTIAGITYLTYLNQVRIDNAKILLMKNLSVTEVCYECGFENLSYFIQLFKKLTGLTPCQWKHENPLS